MGRGGERPLVPQPPSAPPTKGAPTRKPVAAWGANEGPPPAAVILPAGSIKERGLYSEFMVSPRDDSAAEDPVRLTIPVDGGVSDPWAAKQEIISARGQESARGDHRSVVADIALTQTDVPKLQVPWATVPGQPPRIVRLEREKKYYAEQDVEQLLRDEGIDFSLPDPAGPDLYPCRLGMPLEIFDNTDFETRNPEEWVALGQRENRGVPAKVFHEGGEVGAGRWVPAEMREYDAASETYLVSISATGAQKWLPRLYICFAAENPFLHVARIVDALKRRYESEEQMIYNLRVDCMPLEDMPSLDHGQLQRLINQALSTNTLRSSEKSENEVLAPLCHEVNVEYMRTQCQFALDTTLAAANGYATEQVQRGMHNYFEGVNVPAHELKRRQDKAKRPANITGCVPMPPMAYFLDNVSDFSFASQINEPQVVHAMLQIRQRCNWLLTQTPLNYSLNRAVKLKEWEQLQAVQTDSMCRELVNKWSPAIAGIITKQLEDKNKGWYNLNEPSRDVYQY